VNFTAHTIYLLLLFSVSEHDLHISKTDIHYKSDQESIQITIHSFIDDIELALEEYSEADMKLFQTAEHETADSLLEVYYSEHFSISLNGQELEYEFLGREESEDIMGIYTYLEILDIKEVHILEFSNSILLDTYEDQRNITVVKVDNKPKAFHILSGKDFKKTVDF